MSTNPAIKLYRAWDGIFRITQPGWSIHQLKSTPTTALEDVPIDARSLGREQVINHGTTIDVAGVDANGDFIYSLTWQRTEWGRLVLFQLDAQGNFRLGNAFAHYYATPGTYDRVETHTFLGWNRMYRTRDRDHIWHFVGLGERRYCNPRDWREHTYYWRKGSLPVKGWLQLRRVGSTWRVAAPLPRNATELQRDTHLSLSRQYREAEAYYAKWRRRHFKDHGLPDPDRNLRAGEVKAIDYLSQHFRIYDPPKALMPS